MSIVASCGHAVSSYWFGSGKGCCYWKEYADDYSLDKMVHAVAYGILCPTCKKEFMEDDLLLFSEEEKKAWINNEQL